MKQFTMHRINNGIKPSLAPLIAVIMTLAPVMAYMATLPMEMLSVAENGYMTLAPYAPAQLLLLAAAVSIGVSLLYTIIRAKGGSHIKSWHYLLLIAAGVWLFGFGGLATLGGLFRGAQQQTTQSLIPQQTTGTNTGFTNYNIGVTYSESNSIDGSSVSTTSPVYSFYHSFGRRLSNVNSLFGESGVSIASGSTATNYAVDKTDGDFLFVRIDTGTGAHIPDPAKVLKANPGFTGAKWIPVTTATTHMLVGELQISRLGTPNYNNNPSISMNLQVRASLLDTSIAIDSPSDVTSIGTTAGQDTYVTWTLSSVASAQNILVGRSWVTSNQTTAYIDVADITITASTTVVRMKDTADLGATYIINGASATATTTGGVAQFWRFWPLGSKDTPIDASDTVLVGRSSSDADRIQVKVHVKSYFASGVTVTLVLNVRITNYAGALQGTSGSTTGGWLQDSVNLAA